MMTKSDHTEPAGPSPRGASRLRRRWAVLGALAAGSVVLLVVVFLPRGGLETSIAAPVSYDPAVEVCGFPDPLIGKLVATRAKADDESAVPTGWALPADDDLHLIGLHGLDDGVLVEWQRDDASHVFERFGRQGKISSRFTVDFARTEREPHNNGQIAVSPDGQIFAIDSYGGRRELAVFDVSGAQIAAYPVPESAVSTGHPLDLNGVTWVPDLDGKAAILVGEQGRIVHGFRVDGAYLGLIEGMPDYVIGSSAGLVAGLSGEESSTATVSVVDAASGEAILSAPFAPVDESSETISGTPAIEQPQSIVTGPGGGFLISESQLGIEWVNPIGIRLGIWLGDDEFAPAAETGLVRDGEGYWMIGQVEGAPRLVQLSDAKMSALLAQPVSYKALYEPAIAQLGIGVGARTERPFNHFDYGDAPAVRLRFESGWGTLGGKSAADTFQFRYSVHGDPLLADPVTQEERVIQAKVGGGETALELPEARPGAYEVSIRVVDTDTGETIAASCTRYSVGAQGSELHLGDLADGADWGGAGPLRGAQLASVLGVGSHRVQLDFTRLVPDPTARPSADGVDWSALPGADSAEDVGSISTGFAELSEAASYAAEHGVKLIVQLASGGEGEHDAVDAGTWAGWAQIIVAAFAAHAPQIVYWSSWNEPNISFESGSEFATAVEIPFAKAAQKANPRSLVLAGNTLGFAIDWWRDAVSTSVCSVVAGIAVHPYTGWNRSWEEEGFANEGAGFDELREVVGPECAALPVWDTESGWTADGSLPYWSQGANISRKLLWYREDNVAGWTYFFSEGGWGENNLSWSLIQYGSYVKPGALAFANVSRILSGREAIGLVSTGTPFTYAMQFGGADSLVAAWTDEARISVTLTSESPSLDVTDEYGAERKIALENGKATVALTSTPQFFTSPEGEKITFSATEHFGEDLLAGQPVTASSTHDGSDPAIVTSRSVNPYLPWRSGRLDDGSVDTKPSVTIPLKQVARIDRIAVASGSMLCCETGLRTYTVSVQTADGEWQVVASKTDQFWERVVIFDFEPVEAMAVRINVPWTSFGETRVLNVNYTGIVGGLPPPFMGVQTESDDAVSIAAVSAWEVQAP